MSFYKKTTFLLIGVVLGILLATVLCSTISDAKERSYSVKYIDKVIVEVCAENWPEYHGYATTCAMMARKESNYAEKCRRNNLWGLNGGRSSYNTLEDGVREWLRVINLHYYKGVKKTRNCDEQLDLLLERGYCRPVGNYFSDCMRLKDMYNLEKLDKKMFRLIKKKEKEKKKKEKERRKKLRQKSWFFLKYDPCLAPWQVATYRGIIKGGTIRFNTNNNFLNYAWQDVVRTEKGDLNIIYTGNRYLAMTYNKLKLSEIVEEAKG